MRPICQGSVGFGGGVFAAEGWNTARGITREGSDDRLSRGSGAVADATFAREVERGVRLAFGVRLIALLLIAVWTALRIEPPTVYHYQGLILLLALVGGLQVPLARLHNRRGRALQALVILVEMAVLAYALLVPPPGTPPEWTMAMQFRLGNFAYVFVFVALAALTYQPFWALWTAVAAIVAWTAAMLMALRHDGVYTIIDLGRFAAMDAATLQAVLLDPHYLSAVERAQEALLALVLAGIVALACARARRLVRREIQSSAERANLARYFSPDLVAGLAAGAAATRRTVKRDAAILFADLVGFTRLAERLPPEAVIGLLRAFHGRMAGAVFAHGGTLHKFLGDGLMASFGATSLGDAALEDGASEGRPTAERALDCLAAIHSAMAEWNAERSAAGEPTLVLATGLHMGPVVTGDVGDANCLEFAVLGDTVNVASRLEGLCRPLDAAAVVSREVVAAAPAHPLVARLVPVEGETALRGREAGLEILQLPRHAAD